MTTDFSSKLVDLRTVYDADRDDRMRNALHPSECPAGICRYCGKHWRHWAGSKLDGHAQCMVSFSFKQHLAALLFNSTVSFQVVADALGVSQSTVRAWFAWSQMRRTA